MAMANASNDIEHFVNCGVCFCEFDEEIRKPKFLQCAHTVCLKCLQEMFQVVGCLITCPFCRKTFYISDTSSLPNNSSALQMVKLKEIISPPERQACRSTDKNEETKKLAVLKKRKVVQEQLDAIVKSITAVGDQVKQLQEENNIEMAELMSLIEVTPQPTASSSLQNATVDATLYQMPLRQSYIFNLRVYNCATLIGEIRIRPALTFHPEFVQQLGQFCYKSPKNFISTVGKAQAGVFVSISMSHGLFQPTLGATNQTTRIAASTMGEVGMILKKKKQPIGAGPNTITDWNLFIPLNPANYQQRRFIASASAELFGHIVDTSNHLNVAITKLSTSKKNERGSYTMTLESQ
ncbi:hypothetical protein DAPPUDRAFT_316917 [Daphnia pulex]|uniref:RING-type domain-containing protein n=1 Tax=Daphnia pulex TaxID=6669 RepID=E9GED0_DAPPU|nr:hypothetical protein DAPPUDRAFT_316917 [Daphnia pulex]|eukprot:EFX82242.1 hypothetical protein DAPPUDRAFT_316917 [Daphnia pulex]